MPQLAGQEAARSVVSLMAETIDSLPPDDVIRSWDKHRGQGRFQATWKDLSQRTIDCMADGCVRLAALWQSAWDEGQDSQIKLTSLKKFSEDDLMDLYNDPSFVPSMSLQKMFDTGIFQGGLTADAASNGLPTRNPGRNGHPRRRTSRKRIAK
jgi:hypothetical protein